jgi:hypothetical protein
MNKTWVWIASVIVGLCIVGLIGDVRSDEWAYLYARGALIRQVQTTSHPKNHLMYRSPGRGLVVRRSTLEP